MPARWTVLAQDPEHTLEQVSAPPHGPAWGAVHRAPNWRWVLPGSGGVQWRGAGDHVLVDELTAFHIRQGEAYQLQHEVGRSHLVLSAGRAHARGAGARGWLVDPRGVYQLKLAARRLSSQRELVQAAAAVDDALDRAVPLEGVAMPAPLLRARRLLSAAPAAVQSLDELGEAAFCSPYHLARLFRRHLGLSPQQYRLHLRLAVALQRLQAGERDLAGLAHDLGFASHSHFGALFRREVGVTPAQARRELAAD